MDIEQKLKKFQKAYLETEPSGKFLENGWQDLQVKMAHSEQTRPRLYTFYSRPVVFAVMLIFLLGSFAGLVGASGNSLPGEPLYPLKRLSEEVVTVTTGSSLVKVDNRAREIIKLSEEDRDKLQKAVEEYRKAVTAATSSGRNKEELEKELEQNEAEFHQSQGKSSNEYIQEAIETSREGRQEKDEQKKEGEDRSGSNSDQN